MLATTQLFSSHRGHIMDFSDKSVGDIFNDAILPKVNSLTDLVGDDPGGLDEAKQRREAQLQSDLQSEQQQSDLQSQQLQAAFNSQPTSSDFMQQLEQPTLQPQQDYGVDPAGGYDEPATAPSGFVKTSLKLSNYGYASDSSPDHNSNVLRIGHANNKLVDGYSAALSKSLAARHGLKTGDEFEVMTDDGKVLRRRYDDTVPKTYKGKPLPETVDLYELGGNNKFGGNITGIRPLNSQ